MEKKRKEKKESDSERFRKELKDCQRKKQEYLAGWQRARADLINYKKEEKERLQGFLRFCSETLILEVLPILDNFDLAKKNMPKELEDTAVARGLLNIEKQIKEFLKNQELEEIEVLGKKFNPNIAEVVGETKGKDTDTGIIVEVVRKGYRLYNKIIRPAKVKIGK